MKHVEDKHVTYKIGNGLNGDESYRVPLEIIMLQIQTKKRQRTFQYKFCPNHHVNTKIPKKE